MAAPAPDLHALRQVADRAKPLAMADERTLPVLPALAPLLPGGALRRGTTATVSGATGATSLALALVAGGSAAGSWVAAVGVPSLGLAGAAEVGVALERLALVASPPPAAWPTVVAALVDAVDLVLVRPSHRVKGVDARRLAARARERGAVLVEVRLASAAESGGNRGLEGADLRLTVVGSQWVGLGEGHGHLQARRLEVEVGGRRQSAHPRRHHLWLPDPSVLATSGRQGADLTSPERDTADLATSGRRGADLTSPERVLRVVS